jgi:hypothetical protein
MSRSGYLRQAWIEIGSAVGVHRKTDLMMRNIGFKMLGNPEFLSDRVFS